MRFGDSKAKRVIDHRPSTEQRGTGPIWEGLEAMVWGRHGPLPTVFWSQVGLMDFRYRIKYDQGINIS